MINNEQDIRQNFIYASEAPENSNTDVKNIYLAKQLLQLAQYYLLEARDKSLRILDVGQEEDIIQAALTAYANHKRSLSGKPLSLERFMEISHKRGRIVIEDNMQEKTIVFFLHEIVALIYLTVIDDTAWASPLVEDRQKCLSLLDKELDELKLCTYPL